MYESIEEQVLREVESFPSTNITRLYRHAGTFLPEAVGGGCLWMAARLTRLLRERRPGITVSHFDLGEPGSHTTTISDDGTQRLLFEPSLFQVRPFSLTRFAADPTCCTCDVYPRVEPRSPQLKFAWLGPGRLSMELLSPRGNPKRVYQFVFESPASINIDDPYRGLPFLEQQDNLSVYLLNPDGSKSLLLVNTKTRRINVGRVRDKLFLDSEPGFNSRFEKFAERMRMTDRQLRDLLFGAVEIHNARYPPP